MDFVYLFSVLRKRKWIIIGSAVVAAIAAWFFTRNEPKNYRSSTRVSTGYGVPDEIKINDDKFSLFDAEVKFNNAVNTWYSPSVISLLSYEVILHDLKSPAPFRRLNAQQLQSPVYKAVNREQAIKVFEEKLATMSVLTSYKPEEKKLLEFLNLYGYGYKNLISPTLNIYWVQRTDYIQIDCLTENPELSAFLANSAFTQFIRYYRSIRSTIAQESVDTLKSIMDKKKFELDQKNRILRGEGGLDPTTENTGTYSTISELQTALAHEKNSLTDLYSSLQKVNQRMAKAGAATTPSNGNDREEMTLARKAMNEAYTEYLNTGDNAALSRYKQLQAEYNSKYSTSKTTTTTEKLPDNKNDLQDRKNDLEVDIQAANVKIRSIENQINQLKSSATQLSTRGASVESMMEEVKLAEREYFDAKTKYNTAYEMSASAVNNFRQLSPAQPAIEPEPSKRKLIIGMAGTITLLSTMLIIILLAYLDSSIKTPAVFSRVVNLKMISMVNFMNLKNKNLKDIVASGNHENNRIEKERSNVFRESIRKLRYEIETTGKKIFLFTSTQKGQGKTTLIQALSYSLSLSNKKVLIIDTNFCNNDLTVQLNADPVLEKITTADKDATAFVGRIKTLAKDISGGSIFAIGSEGGDYTPSEVLPRENLLQQLEALTSEFDYIFLEGPPLNSFTDSKELTQYVDGVVAIFSATHTIKQIDRESMEFFKGLNGKFCGSVLNMVNLENVNTQ